MSFFKEGVDEVTYCFYSQGEYSKEFSFVGNLIAHVTSSPGNDFGDLIKVWRRKVSLKDIREELEKKIEGLTVELAHVKKAIMREEMRKKGEEFRKEGGEE